MKTPSAYVSLPSNTTTKITTTTGREGPRHDPYAYQRIWIERSGHVVMIHQGLSRFAVIDGNRVDCHDDDEWAYLDEQLQRTVGLNMTMLERAVYESAKRYVPDPMGNLSDYE